MRATLGNSLQKLRHLSRERRALLARAAPQLVASSLVVALLPFRTAIAYGCCRLGRRRSAPVADYVWAVEAASRRIPLRTMCIEQGIAVQRLLRKDGIEAVLHYGARNNRDTGKVEAHVWVSVADTIVIGGEQAHAFAEIASFP